MMSCALDLRCSRGLSAMERRPLLVVALVPSEPMNDATLSTSGSWSTTSATARCRSIILANEMSGAASVTPVIWPVSCWGKKPLDTVHARPPVSAMVPSMTASVEGWWSSTTLSPLS